MCFQSLEVELGNCSMTEDPIPDLRGAMAVGRWTPRTEGRWNVISSFDFRVWVRLMPEFSLNSSNLSRWKYQQWQHWMASMLRWEQPQCDSWSFMDSIVYLLIRSLCFQSKDWLIQRVASVQQSLVRKCFSMTWPFRIQMLTMLMCLEKDGNKD